MKSIKRTITVVFLCVALLFTTATPALAKHYPIINEWAKEEVAAAGDAGLLPFELTGDCRGAVSRSTATVFIVKFIETITEKEIPVGEGSPFTDNDGIIEIEKAYSVGVVTGTGNNAFEPSRPVSREEFCVMLARAIEYIEAVILKSVLPPPTDISGFTDAEAISGFTDADTVSLWARGDMELMVGANLFRGVSDTLLAPKDKISMEQIIVLIYRCFDYIDADNSEEGALLDGIIVKLVKEKTPVQLALTLKTGGGNMAIAGYGGWGCDNDASYAHRLSANDYEVISAKEMKVSDTMISLMSAVEGDDWTIHFYEGSNDIELLYGKSVYCFRATSHYDEWNPISTFMRLWYDEAEFYELGGYYESAKTVIPDSGQGYLAAALACCEAVEGTHLKVTSGSRYRYTYVSCRVAPREEDTIRFREQGEIDGNTYAISLSVIFVPETERAFYQSMTGNTEYYTGNDPSVPEGACEYSRVGFVTLSDEGWRITGVGTGW